MTDHALSPPLGKPRTRRPIPLTTKIVMGLLAGAGLGLSLGEAVQPLKSIGDTYVGLMQMTVLPFIVFSLIGNIGRLNVQELRLLARTGLVTYVLLWLFAVITALSFSNAFPVLHTSHFFSSSLIEAPPTVDWLRLFIPSNPFKSLAENSVPAVVIFCILFGVGLAGFDSKHGLIDLMNISARSLHKVNGMVVQLTPYGIFAITAHATGTIPVREFERLEAYYLTLGSCILLLTFVVLPLLVCSFTRIRYVDVLRISADSLLTAFVTGSVLSSIPLLIEATKSFYQEDEQDGERNAEFAEFILPLAYPFPNSGNVAALLFISFAGWFVGQRLTFAEDLHLYWLGSFLMFGKVLLAIPFLLNVFQIPQDMFQLFLASGVFAGRFSDALGTMHYLAFTLLATARMTGRFEFQWGKFFKNALIIAAAINLTLLLIRSPLESLSVSDDNRHLILNRTNLYATPKTTVTLLPPGPNPVSMQHFKNRLERIKSRGILRVGYQEDYLPYSFINSQGDLVGLDADLMVKFAQELGVSLEFVPYKRSTQQDQIDRDHFDIAISGISVTLERSIRMILTEPYFIVNLALVVPDHRRTEFESEEKINALENPHIAVTEGSLFEESIRRHFPHAIIDRIASPAEFFEDTQADYDVFATHAESGSAWTLVHPQYTVVNPFQHPERAPLAFAVAGFDVLLEDTLNTWISLQKVNGTIDRLSEYWLQGKEPSKEKHRKPLLPALSH